MLALTSPVHTYLLIFCCWRHCSIQIFACKVNCIVFNPWKWPSLINKQKNKTKNKNYQLQQQKTQTTPHTTSAYTVHGHCGNSTSQQHLTLHLHHLYKHLNSISSKPTTTTTTTTSTHINHVLCHFNSLVGLCWSSLCLHFLYGA